MIKLVISEEVRSASKMIVRKADNPEAYGMVATGPIIRASLVTE